MPDNDQLSRRNLIIAAGAGAAIAGIAGSAPAGAASAVGQARPEVLGATIPGLTYLNLDALAFFTEQDLGPYGRYYASNTGIGNTDAPGYLTCSLPLPVGSVIHQINVAYYNGPIVDISRRQFTAPHPVTQPLAATPLPSNGGPNTNTLNLTTPVTIEHGASYALRFFVSPGATIFGVTLGYLPPTQSFVPFTGPTPRVLDTRESGGKLAPGTERVVALGSPGARGAVLNLTVTGTEGATGGFVAVFPANIAWPGNSSINWSAPNQNVANGVITAIDAAGQIRIRGGAANTHVVIDRIGWLI